jgi:sulfite exporter TauE/SafE/copper chaperone CopZ
MTTTDNLSSPAPKEQRYTLHVNGMHCASCELLLETKLAKLKNLKAIKASLKNSTVSFTAAKEPLLETINAPLRQHGYNVSWEKQSKKPLKPGQLLLPLLIAALIFASFLLLQKLGLVNLVNPREMSLPFVFLIGIVASLSTCMAVVGGLVLSISSSYAKEHQSRPLLLFHLSRLISFFLLGGVVGLIGSSFLLTPGISFILNLLLFLIMLLMGINLLEIFDFGKHVQLKLPKSWGHAITRIETGSRQLTALLLGAATFFLPCGFTQSMQMLALSSGNWFTGALIMFVFALGTLPVLGLISFASIQISSGHYAQIFFRSAGFLIIFFATLNLLAALHAAGLALPISLF